MRTTRAALVAAFSCASLAACSTTATVSTSAPSSLTAEARALATNIYNAICVGSPGNPPLTDAVDTLTASRTITLNSDQSALYAAIAKDCSYGAPTTVTGALLWTATLYAAVEKQFPQIRLSL